MRDREFFDLLFQQWAKTTGAEDTFWMPEVGIYQYPEFTGTWNLYAVDQKQEKSFLASFDSEADADFVAAVHGCLPDLVRWLHTSIDEADRLDEERDDQECHIWELEVEHQRLRDVAEEWQAEWEQARELCLQVEERELEATAYADAMAAENTELEEHIDWLQTALAEAHDMICELRDQVQEQK